MALVPAAELTRARAAVQRFTRGFTPGQKAVTLASVAILLGGALVFMWFSGRPTYTPLFTNLKPADAATITQHLAADKVPYQLSDGGATVNVPASAVARERLALAQAGLPASSTAGLSLLDKESVTASSLQQQAHYLQALQGELEQTIDAINGVTSSQVNVALPANQDFALSDAGPTGASVLVNTADGRSLTAGEVQAIVHLVGSSVPGLKASDVTVADSSGNLLAGPGVVGGAPGADQQTQAYDASVAAKVQGYLASVLGANNADVQVNATLDYNQVNTQTQSIITDPTTGKPTSFCTQTQTSTQTYTNTAPKPGGPAGSITPPVNGSSTGNYNNTQNSQTCETSQQTRTEVQAPGTVKTLSVAVLVNSRALPAGVSQQSLQQGVAAAAGISTTRGDTLAFSAMPFSTTAAQQAAAVAKAAKRAAAQHARSQLIRTGAVGGAVLLALVLLLLAGLRGRRPAQAGSALVETDLLAALRIRGGDEHPMPTSALAEVKKSREAQDVNAFIDAQPDDVAAMLRSWLTDRRGTQGAQS